MHDGGYWQRAATRRMGRRSLLQASGLTGAAAFLAACGGSNNSKSAAPTAAATTAPAASASAVASATSASGTAAPGGSPAAKATVAAVATPGKLGGTLREGDNTQTPHFSPFHPGADPSFINFWRRSYGYYDHLWLSPHAWG
ncbi:MAG: hypothetical protein ACYDCQ_04955 [Dehalococcoidia bacterium]